LLPSYRVTSAACGTGDDGFGEPGWDVGVEGFAGSSASEGLDGSTVGDGGCGGGFVPTE